MIGLANSVNGLYVFNFFCY